MATTTLPTLRRAGIGRQCTRPCALLRPVCLRSAAVAFQACPTPTRSYGSHSAFGVKTQGLNVRRPYVGLRATPDKSGSEQDPDQLVVSIGLAALWVGLCVYAFQFSPNQTPYRDQIFLERILGIGEKDGFVVNQVFVSLFNLMGIYPAIFAALLVPAGRSENKVPAWPFITLSFFFGAYALLPYMALWKPMTDNEVPPPPKELQGWNRLYMRGAETPYLPAALLAGALYYVYLAASAGGDTWLDYFKLFDESRFVHATTLDFATLTALMPYWMDNDATARNWDKKSLVPVLSFIPVIGPAVYLLLRPKTKMQ